MSSDVRLRAVPRQFDLLTIMGGTNDWRGNVPIGRLEDDDPATFLGGYRAVLRRIRFINGDAKVVMLTPPYAEAPEFKSDASASGDRNRLGLVIGDYVEAIAALAERQGIELLDLYTLCDFRSRISEYYDDGDRIHFNQNGLEAIAAQMEQRFQLLGAQLPRKAEVVTATLRDRRA